MNDTEKELAQRQNSTPATRMTDVINMPFVQEQLRRSCGKNPDAFAASMLDCYTGNKALQQCDPRKVAVECLKAAILNLPLSPQLGFAYVVPYKGQPTFMVGYKGMIQLAMRTGAYKSINAGPVFEGEFRGKSRLTGAVDIDGERSGDTVIGYFAHFEMLNGFSKTLYMTSAEVEAHGKKFSKAFSAGPWKSDFDAMATKTVLRQLLGKYGMMSIEIQKTMDFDGEAFDAQYVEHANSTPLPLSTQGDGREEASEWEQVDPETGEVLTDAAPTQEQTANDQPPFPVE